VVPSSETPVLNEWAFTEAAINNIDAEYVQNCFDNMLSFMNNDDGDARDSSENQAILLDHPRPRLHEQRIMSTVDASLANDPFDYTILSSLRTLSDLNLSLLAGPNYTGPELSIASEATTGIDDIFCSSQLFTSICRRLLSSLQMNRRHSPVGDENVEPSSPGLLDLASILSIFTCFINLLVNYDIVLDSMLSRIESHTALNDRDRGKQATSPMPSINIGKFVLGENSPITVSLILQLVTELFTDMRSLQQDISANALSSRCSSSTRISTRKRADEDQEKSVLEATADLITRKQEVIGEKINRLLTLIKKIPRS
jgi:hypothetical protein